jgi:hypothetical protein
VRCYGDEGVSRVALPLCDLPSPYGPTKHTVGHRVNRSACHFRRGVTDCVRRLEWCEAEPVLLIRPPKVLLSKRLTPCQPSPLRACES